MSRSITIAGEAGRAPSVRRALMRGLPDEPVSAAVDCYVVGEDDGALRVVVRADTEELDHATDVVRARLLRLLPEAHVDVA